MNEWKFVIVFLLCCSHYMYIMVVNIVSNVYKNVPNFLLLKSSTKTKNLNKYRVSKFNAKNIFIFIFMMA